MLLIPVHVSLIYPYPYFFILNPIYKFGAGIDYNSHIKKGYGYIKETCTGINNIDIACDYALYKSI